MPQPRRNFLKIVIGAAAGFCSLSAWAQSWPDKAIKLVLGYTTGGATDSTARIIGRPLEQIIKQSVIMDYKPGAGASIGAEFVARAAPDGYTLGLTDTGPLCIMPNLRKVSYDPLTSFTPISYVCTTGLVLIVNPDLPVKNIQELIALVKTKPGQFSYASSGVGSVHHLAGELFKVRAGLAIVHIPYRGAGPALTDLVGGQIPIMFATIGPALAMIAAGKARALGVTSLTRSSSLPNVPTIAEQGLKGYEAVLRFMVMGPAKMPTAITSKLQADFKTVISDNAVVGELKKLGNDDIVYKTPSEIEAMIQDDYRKWGALIKDLKITLDT
jgi:tripartite-type tricarboxylate transporter receptor subunit TctC